MLPYDIKDKLIDYYTDKLRYLSISHIDAFSMKEVIYL